MIHFKYPNQQFGYKSETLESMKCHTNGSQLFISAQTEPVLSKLCRKYCLYSVDKRSDSNKYYFYVSINLEAFYNIRRRIYEGCAENIASYYIVFIYDIIRRLRYYCRD